MNCPKCNFANPENSTYCCSCGSRLSGDPVPEKKKQQKKEKALPPKDYKIALKFYPETEEGILKQKKKLKIFAILFLILGIATASIYIGYFLILISIIMFLKLPKYKKVLAQFKFEAEQKSIVLDTPEIKAIPDLSIESSFHRSSADMPLIDFSRIYKNTTFSKIFPLVVLDVETTGLNPERERIVEVSAFKFETNFTPSARFSTLINPQKEISAEVTKINHITNDMVKDAPLFSQIKNQFEEFIGGCNIAGYNVRFDLGFLFAEGVDLSPDIQYFDVYDFAKRQIKKSEIANYKLTTVSEFLKVPLPSAHRSLFDAYATAKVFETLYSKR